MTTLKQILVPTDFSEPARNALRYASELARRSGASLTVMYADRFLPPLEYSVEFGIWEDDITQILEARAHEQLDADVKMYVDPSVHAEPVVRFAAATDGILVQARESGADLIVMGTHGRTGIPRLAFGSVTESVMRAAAIPVLAVPPEATDAAPLKKILCPVNDTTGWLAALKLAAAFAPEDATFFIVGPVDEEVIDTTETLRELQEQTPPELVSRCTFSLFSQRDLAAKIAHFASDSGADLVVAVEPAVRKMGDVLHGTFAERLMQLSRRPVLVVNPSSSVQQQKMRFQENPSNAIASVF